MPRRAERSPVRVSGREGDWRIRYWDSGTVGIGVRRTERAASEVAAGRRAALIERRLAAGMTGPARAGAVTFGEVAALWIDAVRPQVRAGTLSAYRSDCNRYLLPTLSAVPVDRLGIDRFTAVLEVVVASGASRRTLDGVVRTLGALTTWATAQGMFESEPWGPSACRRTALRHARVRATDARLRPVERPLPTLDDVDLFATAMGEVYEHGEQLVWLMAACGIRLGEALGLRGADVDQHLCTLRIERQADRHQPWPATTPPKSGVRKAYVWAWIQPMLAAAHERTAPDGWVFPPDLDDRGRAYRWWSTRLSERLTEVRRAIGWAERGWVTHDLRHLHASLSLTPTDAGGMGLSAATVAAGLGHHSPRLTLDTYVHNTASAAEVARATRHRPR